MSAVCITGANRGIGLEFVRQYAQRGAKVAAVCREPKDAELLHKLAKDHPQISIYGCDLSKGQEIESLAAKLNSEPLDLLINNAGAYGIRQSLSELEPDNFLSVMQINALAAPLLTAKLLPALQKGSAKTIINITSRMGSIEDNSSGGSYAYRASKAALNAISKSMQIDLKPNGFQVLALHPGWVQTRMGGGNAIISAEESVSEMLKLIDNAQQKDGLFYHCNGEQLPF